MYITVLQILTGSTGLAVGSSLTLTGAGASVVVPIATATFFVSSTAALKSNESYRKLKLRYTKLRDWINMINLLYQKTPDKPMVEKNRPTRSKRIEK